MHIHKIKKTVKATTEKLPDIMGTVILYAGAPEADVDVTYRDTAEPTLVAGGTHTVGAYTGLVEQCTADIQPQIKEDGSVVWEMVSNLLIPGGTV